MSSPDRDSPFAPSRFLFREDSEKFQTDLPRGKLVHFASTSTVGLERTTSLDEITPPVIRTRSPTGARMDNLRLALVGLAIALIAFAVSTRLSQDPWHMVARSTFRSLKLSWSSDTVAQHEATLPPMLRAQIQQLVVETVEAYRVGRLAEWDFARKANGGRIALQVTSGYHGVFRDRANDPMFTIDHDSHADKCWILPPLPSQLGLRLPLMIRPSYVTITHASLDETTYVEQAPQNMTLWGVVEGKVNTHLYETLTHPTSTNRPPLHDQHVLPIKGSLVWAPLASFVYDIHLPSTTQSFPIHQQYLDSGLTFGVYALVVHSNWGSTTTCLYNVGIHGVPAN